MHEFKKTTPFNKTQISSKTRTSFKDLEPLIDKPFSSGRPPMKIEKILEDFKKEFISKENILSNPTILAYNRLDRKYKSIQGHFFHSLRNLHKRAYSIHGGWYSHKGPLAYVLVKIGWFSEQEVGPFLKNVKKQFSLEIKEHLSKKASQRMKIINNRIKIAQTLKDKWKEESFRQRMLNVFEQKKETRSLIAKKLWKRKDYRQKLTLCLRISNFLKSKEFSNLKEKFSLNSNEPIIRIDTNNREWLLTDKSHFSLGYSRLPPLVGLYSLICLKHKKILPFNEIEKISKKLAFLLEEKYSSFDKINQIFLNLGFDLNFYIQEGNIPSNKYTKKF